MNSLTDEQLLRDYIDRRSETAFGELTRRHVDFIYSAALRMVRDPHLAEDVTQGAFLALAQNARQLAGRPVLSGWLHRVAQNLAANTVRSEVRRRAREKEAAAMNEILAPESDALWENIAPYLDAALAELNESERDALLLRYFERKSAREMAQILGTSEDAAQKRVSRAVERLREFFAKRNVAIGAGGLVILISSNAVQSAPVGLASAISSAAVLAGSAVQTSALVAATKTIAMTTIQKSLIAATLAVVAGAGVFEAHQASQLREQNQILRQQQAPLAKNIRQLQADNESLSNRLANIGEPEKLSDSQFNELLNLRGEVGVLQRQANEATQKTQAAEQKLESALSAETKFKTSEKATVSAMKYLGLDMLLYAKDHNNQFPTSLYSHEFLKKYESNPNLLRDIPAIEYMNGGEVKFVSNVASGDTVEHPNMVLLRERIARQSPDGTWRRLYLFADGSVQTATSYDGNFDAWEKANTYSPSPNPNN
ncbi:MAG TPA: sigma-70 family RNA polymerase sigma factor [Verrucomicrobiae bacterium]|nr:sigma-70 family RNA polymerase sigma factor [Verrucomicrobiae bacterium]